MTSKLKAMGLAIFAIAMMSMVWASAAQAANGEIHISVGGTAQTGIVTGELSAGTEHVFKVKNGETKCTQALLEGTVSGGGVNGQVTATEGTLTAQYTGCQALGFLNATVDMNGCKYTLTGNQAQALTALVDITGCTAGKQIQITAGSCTIDVPEQTGLSHVTFTNVTGPPKHLQDHDTVTGITYEFTGTFCPLGVQTNVLTHDGSYTGTTTVKGYEDSATQEQITHNGHQFTRHKCGAQVDLFAT